ncbi:MAG: penicillin-binding protein 1C [Pseudomonadota bacterium]
MIRKISTRLDAGRWTFQRRPVALKLVCLLFFAVVALLLIDRFLPPPLDRAADLSPVVIDREGNVLHAFTTTGGLWRFHVTAEDIDPTFRKRLIAIEDKRFYSHAGVDAWAIARAAISNVKRRRIVSGGSTITMQTARLLEPRPRTLGSKLIEAFRALQLERRLSKDEILALYLTLTPYGGNLEGVRAASLAYFDKEPERLTDAEQALLIALPQAPEARRPDRRSQAALIARNAILEELVTLDQITPQYRLEATNDPLPQERRPLHPGLAYHASNEAVRQDAGRQTAHPLTLDYRLQSVAEVLARDGVDAPAQVAMILVDTKTQSVRALVGSSSLQRPGGWIDLTKAVRSPGSALKPFIYGIAFDDGVVGPATIIDDMPRAFGSYRPENFDRRFRGDVRAAEALKHSLNIPAVATLGAVGATRFVNALDSAGAGLTVEKNADGETGLAVGLGGVGVSSRSLAALYTALANQGMASPINIASTDIPAMSVRLMSETAATSINNILKTGPSLSGRAPAHLVRRAPDLAFKTGTSYGYRDAWAAGHAGGYAAVVWVGRADGAPRPGQTGRKAALPILFKLMDIAMQGDGAYEQRPAADILTASGPVRLKSSQATSLDAGGRQAPLRMIFPGEGVELIRGVESESGYILSASGGAGEYTWYVNGRPIKKQQGRAFWRPDVDGFFEIEVADEEGSIASETVRVRRAIMN